MSNNQALVNALRGNLTEVNMMINTVTQKAKDSNIDVYKMQDMQGNFVLIPLLAAKAQILSGLAHLK